MTKTHSKKNSRFRRYRIIILLTGTIAVLAGMVMLWYYSLINKPVIDLQGRNYSYFYIHTGSGFGAVTDSLVKKKYLTDRAAFEWLARKKNYDSHVRPGRYRLVSGMRNNALVNLLRSGMQEPVRLVLQGLNTREDLAGRIGKRLEVDSLQLSKCFNNPACLAPYGVAPATVLALFIPDTYEFYWNTSADQLLDRMFKEFKRFWNAGRRDLAGSLHLSVTEVVTLASIVEKETNKNDEKPLIAGVYLNRLKKKIPLQADPTVIFAWNDYRIRRVLKAHTEIKSPYNTYLHAGLPPGPICLPSVSSIDAVLHADKHDYIYFCAREDLSGYHNFATDLEGHNRNARKYQKALDKKNIR